MREEDIYKQIFVRDRKVSEDKQPDKQDAGLFRFVDDIPCI